LGVGVAGTKTWRTDKERVQFQPGPWASQPVKKGGVFRLGKRRTRKLKHPKKIRDLKETGVKSRSLCLKRDGHARGMVLIGHERGSLRENLFQRKDRRKEDGRYR